MTLTAKPSYDYAADVKAAAAAAKMVSASEIARSAQMAALAVLDDKHKFRLVIDGTPIDEVKSATLTSSIDNAADGWTAIVPVDPSWTERHELLRPFGYQKTEVYLGGELRSRGKLYNVKPSFGESGSYSTLAGWTFVADALDSTAMPPYEMNNVTLEKYAKARLEPLGIEVVWDAGADKPFPRVTCGKTELLGSHLLGLAKQRNVLMMSDSESKVTFHKVSKSDPVASFIEGLPPFIEGGAEFDGRKRYGLYTAVSSSPGRSGNVTVIDDAIPITRHTTITANDADDADTKSAALRAASKALADALAFPINVPTWYSDDAMTALWEPNTLVNVISPSLYLPDGIDLLIRSVDYRFEPNGTRATLQVVPPQVYTGEPLEVWK